MGLQYKRKSKLGLENLQVLIQDTSLDSKGYFNITEFPSYFGNGKNLVRLKGNSGNLLPGSPIYVEVLDVNGNTIYHELPNYSEPDLTRYISVWVYNDTTGNINTPNGLGKVIICGTAQQTVDGRPIPNEWKNKINIRWVREIPVTREKKSPSKIIFLGNELPKVKLEEVTNYYKKVELLSESILLTTQSFRDTGSNDLSPILVSYDYNAGLGTTGDVRTNPYSPYQSDFPKLTFRKRTLVNNTASLVFAQNLAGKMTGGTIEINLSQSTTAYNSLKPTDLPQYITKPVRFTASILSVDDYSTLSISFPLTASNYVGGEERNRTYFTEFKDAEWVIRYVSTSSYTDSPFENPTVLVTVDGINPLGGNVDRIKVYYRPSFNVSDFEFGGSTTLFSNEESVSFYATVKNFRRNTAYDFKVEFENIEEDVSDSNIVIYDFLVEEAIMGSPAPPDKSIQYNNSDAFEGSYDLTYDYNYENVGIGTYNPTTKLQIFNELGFNVDGTVFTLLQSGSNHIYVGGQFERYLGRSYNGIIRLDLSGSIDTGFNPGKGFNGPVRAIQFASGSSDIYVGGEFTQYSGSKDVKYFVRLKSNGTISSNFKEHGELNGRVNTIYVSTETGNSGSVYLGGAFTQYSGSAGRILKVDRTGSVINSFKGGFDTGSSTEIFAIAGWNPNSHLYVGGTFTSYSGSSDYQYGNGGILKINNNGSVITTFNQSSSISGGTSGSAVYTIYNPYITPDEYLYIGGNFTKYSGSVAHKLMALNPNNGSMNSAWSSPAAYFSAAKSIRTMHFIGDDTSPSDMLVAGQFDGVAGDAQRVTIVNPGTGDSSLNSIRSVIPDKSVFTSIKLSPSASIIGGSFSKYRVGGTPGATTTGKLVNSDKIIIIETPSLAPYTSSYSGFFDFRNRDRDAFFISSSIGTFIGSQSVLWPQVSDNPFVIKNSGDVGIGTTTPQQKIHIEGGVIARLPNVQQPWVILYNSQSGVFTYGTASGEKGDPGPSGPANLLLQCYTPTAPAFNRCRFPNESDDYNLTFGFNVISSIDPITVISASLFSGSSKIWETGSVSYPYPIQAPTNGQWPITWTISTSSIGNVTYRFVVTASYTSDIADSNAWETWGPCTETFTITPPANLDISCNSIETNPTWVNYRHNRETSSYTVSYGFTHNNPWSLLTGCSSRQLNITLISASLFSGSSKIWETGSVNYLNTAGNPTKTFSLPTHSFGSVTYTFYATASLSESRFDSTTWDMIKCIQSFTTSERNCPNEATFNLKTKIFQAGLGSKTSTISTQQMVRVMEMGDTGSIQIDADIDPNQPGWDLVTWYPYTVRYRKDNSLTTTTNLEWTSDATSGTSRNGSLQYYLITGSLTGSLGNDDFNHANIPIDSTRPYDIFRPGFQGYSNIIFYVSSSFSSSANPSGVPYFNLNEPPRFCNEAAGPGLVLHKTISIRSGSFFDADYNSVITTQSIYDLKRWDMRLGGNSMITGSVGFDLEHSNGIIPTPFPDTPDKYPLNTIGFLGSANKREYFIVNRNVKIESIWDATIFADTISTYTEHLIGHYAVYVGIKKTQQANDTPSKYYVKCVKR